MEQNKQHLANEDASNRKDLEPGRGDRNLLSDTRTEAPIDKDLPISATQATDAGDETYEDENEDETDSKDYYERRAPDNVRK